MESYKQKMIRKVNHAKLKERNNSKIGNIFSAIIIFVFITLFLSIAIHQIFFK